MKNSMVWTVFLVAAFLAALSTAAGGYPDPARFEAEIRRFEQSDSEKFPPAGAVLCTGSSSMRMWHPTIKEDLEPLTVIPRGFGGSTLNDLLHYADRIVIPYKPRAIVVYEGDNDSKAGVSEELFTQTLAAFLKKVHDALPGTRLYFLSVKPSPSRITLMPLMRRYNEAMRSAAAADPRVTYIDVFNPMLDDTGSPIPSVFLKDNLHMNREGYLLWTKVVRPVLVEAEQSYEQ